MKIERLTSNVLLPSLSRFKIEEELSHLLNTDEQKIEKSERRKTDILEVVIIWQQKLFSRVCLHFSFSHFRILSFI